MTTTTIATVSIPPATTNDPARRGQLASTRSLFGPCSRYALFAIHTRFSGVQWFVTDAETPDDITDGPLVIRQADDALGALSGMETRM